MQLGASFNRNRDLAQSASYFAAAIARRYGGGAHFTGVACPCGGVDIRPFLVDGRQGEGSEAKVLFARETTGAPILLRPRTKAAK